MKLYATFVQIQIHFGARRTSWGLWDESDDTAFHSKFVSRRADAVHVTGLKGLAQAKIIKKSVILFWLINTTIWCEHVPRLKLQKFFLIFVLRIYQLG